MQRNKLPLVIAFALSIVFQSRDAQAQFSSILGYDSGAKTKYECVRYGNPKLNFVKTTKSGHVKSLKIATAVSALNRRYEDLKERKASLKDLLQDAKREHAKLLKNPLAALHPEKIDRSKRKVASLTAKVNDIAVQIENMKKLIKDTQNCKKPSDPKINGTVQFLSGLYDNGQSFYVVVAYVYDLTTSNNASDFCADLTGQIKIPAGWSGVTYPNLPIRAHISANSDPCFRLGFLCLDPKTQGVVLFASNSGPQAPGSCPYRPSDCSLDAALADAHKYFDAITVANVTPFISTCQ